MALMHACTVLASFLLLAVKPTQADQGTHKTIAINAFDLAFDPEVVQASPGDVLEFHFMPHNHSVVMGDFDSPCKAAKSGGFYSGFFALNTGEADRVFRVTVNDTKPFVYYCSQDVPGHQHCQGGMVGVVNADSDALAKYKDASQRVPMADSPVAPFGGTFAPAPSATASTTTTGPSTSGSPTTAPSGPAQSTTLTAAAGRGLERGFARDVALGALGSLAFAILMG